tara:strand:+ start:121 stop:723 length:603 start_codon:yes stop_codon:yes gene_type:complete
VQISIGISVKGTKTSSPPSAPVNTVAPVIDGNANVGSTLTLTSVGTYTGAVPITYTYQWYRGVTVIIGQTSTTYITQAADAGEQVICQVQASNAYGSAFSPSNYIIPVYFAPTNITPPEIDGLALWVVGDTISFTGNTWDGNPVPVLTYQWLRNGSNITGETNDTYLLVLADMGQLISVKCTATNSQGSAFETSNQVTIF